jgi:hypothetical protein
MRSLTFPPSLKPGIWGAVIGCGRHISARFLHFRMDARRYCERDAHIVERAEPA